MRSGTIVQEFLSSHFSAAIANLEDFRATKDPEALHQYRVEMKKVFSVVRYLERHHRFSAVSGLHAEWKLFFKTCGVLREWQLYHQWLKRRSLRFSSAAYGMLGKIRRMEKKIISGIPRHIKEMEEGFFILEELLGHTDETDKRQYLEKLIGKISDMFTDHPAEDTWHPLRRRLKDAIDVVNWLPAGDQKKILPVHRVKGFRKLQSLIGEWHDSLLFDNWENSLYSTIKKPGARLVAEHERIRRLITNRTALQKKNIRLMLEKSR